MLNAMENEKHMEEMKNLFYSFIEVLSTAIDERTPYNANHTRNLVKNIEKVIDYINSKYECEGKGRYVTLQTREQLIISGWLHDIGKMITPLEIMNKATRLEGKRELIESRLEYIEARIMIEYLEGKLSKEQLNEKKKQVSNVREHIDKCNKQGDLQEEDIQKTLEIAEWTFVDNKGRVRPWLTESEIENLCILKGTLNMRERRIMEKHVELTGKLLSKMNFEKLFSKVPEIAKSHHECLDGTGYPLGLKGEELSFEARLLAVLDIYEALTSHDRPYKKPLSLEQTFKILDSMSEGNKIDKEIVSLLKEMNEISS